MSLITTIFEFIFPSFFAIVVGAFVLDYYRRRHRGRIAYPPGFNPNKQAVKYGGEEYVFGSPLNQGGKLLQRASSSVTTLYEVFLHGLETSHNGDCLGHRPGDAEPYVWKSYSNVFREARDFGAGLLHLGVKPGANTFVGIYAKNSPEWFISALGCVTQGIVIVPLYDTLGADAATFIVNQADIGAVVCEARKVNALLDKIEKTPTLKHIIVLDQHKESAEMQQKATEKSVNLYTFDTVVHKGEVEPKDIHPPKPDDLYIICYTSGTTGLPKGVMLTHRNVVSNSSCLVKIDQLFKLNLAKPGDSVISYLPLSHMMEQMIHWISIYNGVRIGYFRGNIKGLTDDLKCLQPALVPAVPRVLSRMYDNINATLRKAGPFARWLYQMGYDAKLAEMKQGIVRRDTIWDKLVFRKIQAELGGKVKIIITGSAPISAEVLETCRVVTGAQIFEGYGQTECTALVASTMPGDMKGGHVGGPALCSLIRLNDVPELDYWCKDGKGEVCVKGPMVTKGYYKDPERTAELFDDQGWLHTGDVAMWLPNGALKIIDRKKHIFKLAQGEYVAPEKIENVYIRAAVVEQVFVDGNSLERFLVAIVVPNESVLMRWHKARLAGRDSNLSFAEVCDTRDAADYVLAELQQLGKENKLNTIEQVRAVKLSAQLFTVENGLLTPTLKAKRPQLRKFYDEDIQRLYKENPMAG